MRFVVIGAAGLVGRHVRAVLSDRDVVCTYRSDPASNGIRLDITDHHAVRDAIRDARPDVVVLAAAEAYVERCEKEPEATRRVNVDAARVIAERTRAENALLVVFSSEYVFDGSDGTYREGDARAPINEYGRQKVALEDIALATGRALVCRTSGVFGADPRRRNFVCQLVDRLRGGRTFDVASDQLITPSYAPDLARAVIELASAGHTGVFHVAGPRILPRPELARMVAEAYRLPTGLLRPRTTAELGLAAPRPLRCGLAVDKLTRTLGHGLADPGEALREMAAEEIAA